MLTGIISSETLMNQIFLINSRAPSPRSARGELVADRAKQMESPGSVR